MVGTDEKLEAIAFALMVILKPLGTSRYGMIAVPHALQKLITAFPSAPEGSASGTETTCETTGQENGGADERPAADGGEGK